jgi:hypothetical protein
MTIALDRLRAKVADSCARHCPAYDFNDEVLCRRCLDEVAFEAVRELAGHRPPASRSVSVSPTGEFHG